MTTWDSISVPNNTFNEIDKDYREGLLRGPVITLENFKDGDDVIVLDSGLDEFSDVSGPSTEWSDVT